VLVHAYRVTPWMARSGDGAHRRQPVALTGEGGNLPTLAQFQAAMPASAHFP
jgi:hypothetical protein